MKITSLQNERVKQWALLKEKRGRDQTKRFIIEGEHLLEMALRYDIVETILYEGVVPYSREGIELIEVSRSIIEKLAFTKTPTHCLAICKMMKEVNLDSHFLIALDDVQDPGNGGMIVRSALAFHFEEVLLSSHSFDPYNDKFLRATMGAFFALPLRQVSLVPALKEYQQRGYEIVVADLKPQAIPISDYIPSDRTIVAVGSEGQGISQEVINLANRIVTIPMSSQIDSLNVGVAASILMYHIDQRRNHHGNEIK